MAGVGHNGDRNRRDTSLGMPEVPDIERYGIKSGWFRDYCIGAGCVFCDCIRADDRRDDYLWSSPMGDNVSREASAAAKTFYI